MPAALRPRRVYRWQKVAKREGSAMLVIGHRGCPREELENSWASFAKAQARGCPRIELDLQWTRDRQIVVMHDDELCRTTGKRGRISQMTAEDLRQLRLLNGEPIPFFHEVLARFLPQLEINAEVKGDRPELALASAELVAKSSYSEQVIFSSFHARPLQVLKKYKPKLHTAVLWGSDTGRLHPLYYFWPLKFLQHCQATIFHPEAERLSPALMRKLKAQGYRVYPWVPLKGERLEEREKLWQDMLNLEVDGLCTNEPEAFSAWLKNKAKAR